jgi:hypothetical protein
MRSEYPASRVAAVLGNVLTYLAGVLVIGRATLKVAQPPAVVAQFRELGRFQARGPIAETRIDIGPRGLVSAQGYLQERLQM